MGVVGEEQPANRSLFDDFEAYRTPRAEDLHQVLTAGLVVLDTNVLLDLYRYNRRTREDLLGVLSHVQEQLWIPHQVAQEFWAGRDLTLMTRRDSTRDALASLERPARAGAETVENWARSIGLDEAVRDTLTAALDRAYSHVREAISGHAADSALDGTKDTDTDQVIQALDSILAGRVGSPLPTKDHAEALKEAERRGKAEIPPGYMDFGKPDGRGAGDYLVWEQTLREAEYRGLDVLLVTRDSKDDWWRRTRGVPLGPRPELAKELMSRSGGRLFMQQPQELLRLGRELLDVPVEQASVEEVSQLEDLPHAELIHGTWRALALAHINEMVSGQLFGHPVSIVWSMAGVGIGNEVIIESDNSTIGRLSVEIVTERELRAGEALREEGNQVLEALHARARVRRLDMKEMGAGEVWSGCVVIFEKMSPSSDYIGRIRNRLRRPGAYDSICVIPVVGSSKLQLSTGRLDPMIDEIAQLIAEGSRRRG